MGPNIVVIITKVLLVRVWMANSSKLKESRFIQDTICGIQEREKMGCSREISEVGLNSTFRCLTNCARKDSCTGASMNDAGMCFHHETCLPAIDCNVNDSAGASHSYGYYWSRYCVFGVWDSLTESCKCSRGSFGVRCNGLYENCQGLLLSGHTTGDYRILIDPDQDRKNPMSVLCRVEGGRDTSIVIMRNSGGLDFNRTWNEYVNGFYKDNNNVWGGLRNWHTLSSNFACDKMISKLVLKGLYGTGFMMYSRFVLSGENENYKFLYGPVSHGYSGMDAALLRIGDCMEPIANTSFSSWDQNNDKTADVNCASLAGSGWWYSGCDDRPCNLLAWNLDNWTNVSRDHRLDYIGLDVQSFLSMIDHVEMVIKCR